MAMKEHITLSDNTFDQINQKAARVADMQDLASRERDSESQKHFLDCLKDCENEI